MEDGQNWIPEPVGTSSPPITNGRTARGGEVAVTLTAMRVQQRIAEAETPPELRFLVLDVELANDAGVPYTFHPDRTTIHIAPQNEYNRALASLITIPPGSDVADLASPGVRACQYDPLVTSQLDDGTTGDTVIAAKSVKMGRLAYRVPVDADECVFAYESDDVSITIPFRKPSLS
jgi:hypothetical protein